jgi:putative transposase
MQSGLWARFSHVPDYGWSREALAIEADTSLKGNRVVRVLDQSVVRRGKPQMIHGDWTRPVGSLQSGEAALHRARQAAQNGYIESFNGRLRDECLNQEWFTSLFHARCVLAAWKDDYNSVRPHSALDYQTPTQWVQSQVASSTLQ